MSEQTEPTKGERCNACGRPYLTIYHVPDDLWAKVTGRTDGGGTWCPTCFEFIASEKGYSLYWEARTDEFPTAAAKAREEAAPRHQVRQFAELMEERLKANDHKGGWKGERLPYLMRRLREEVEELSEALLPDKDWAMEAEKVGREAADVANFVMMVADICGALAASGTASGKPPIPDDLGLALDNWNAIASDTE